MNLSWHRALIAGLMLTICAGPARAVPHLPDVIERMVARTGIIASTTSGVADRMERARHEDVVVESTDVMFDDGTVR